MAACSHNVTQSRTNQAAAGDPLRPCDCSSLGFPFTQACHCIGVFLSLSVCVCVYVLVHACVRACKACWHGCCDLPSPAHPHPHPATPGRMSKRKGKRGRGMYVAANRIFMGNSISLTYGADLYPNAGLLSRQANCVSNWKSKQRTSFTKGAELRKI